MTDLVLWAVNKSRLDTWARESGLYEEYIEIPAEIDRDGVEVTPAVISLRVKKGVEWSWWGGDGRFTTAPATYNKLGKQTSPPKYLAGVFVIIRTHHKFLEDDRLLAISPREVVALDRRLTPSVDDTDRDKGLARSKIANEIRSKGTAGAIRGISYHDMGGVRLFPYEDLMKFCSDNNVPGHAYL